MKASKEMDEVAEGRFDRRRDRRGGLLRKVSNWLLHFKQLAVRALIYFYFRPGSFRSRFHGGL